MVLNRRYAEVEVVPLLSSAGEHWFPLDFPFLPRRFHFPPGLEGGIDFGEGMGRDFPFPFRRRRGFLSFRVVRLLSVLFVRDPPSSTVSPFGRLASFVLAWPRKYSLLALQSVRRRYYVTCLTFSFFGARNLPSTRKIFLRLAISRLASYLLGRLAVFSFPS